MKLAKPTFIKLELEIPTPERLLDTKQTKYNRFSYEWYMESKVHNYFNLTQELAERTHEYTKHMIKKTAILAGTSTAVAVAALVVAVISFRKKH